MRTTHSSCDSFDRIPNWPNSKQQQNTSEANTLQTHIQPKDPKAREGQLQNQSLKISEFENLTRSLKISMFENLDYLHDLSPSLSFSNGILIFSNDYRLQIKLNF